MLMACIDIDLPLRARADQHRRGGQRLWAT